MKVLIFGASGSGTTTLGKGLAKAADFIHLDADDYYWRKTTNPYTVKVPLAERNAKLKLDFNQYDRAIISGSLVSWGEYWESAFDLAIFIHLKADVRMARLLARELDC